MKIIGSAGPGKCLIEATCDEMDKLAGRPISRRIAGGYYSWETEIPVGTTINVVKAFDQIHRNDQRRREIQTVRKTLEGVLNSLDIIDPFIDEPKVEEPAPEVQP